MQAAVSGRRGATPDGCRRGKVGADEGRAGDTPSVSADAAGRGRVSVGRGGELERRRHPCGDGSDDGIDDRCAGVGDAFDRTE